MGQNVEWKKRRLGQKVEDRKTNVDWDKTSKSKKRRLEISSTGKNANMNKMSINKKSQLEKTSTMGRKGRREKNVFIF